MGDFQKWGVIKDSEAKKQITICELNNLFQHLRQFRRLKPYLKKAIKIASLYESNPIKYIEACLNHLDSISEAHQQAPKEK
ncbi:MAG: hypothetical protein P8077_09505, partial [Gammaproteobacteria bacterium]